MDFPLITITKHVCYFLLCQSVSSSLHSVLEKEASSSVNTADSIFEEFFAEFERSYLAEIIPEQITVIGATPEELRQVQSSIEYPYIICTTPKKCADPKVFHLRNVFIIFLRSLKENNAEKYKVLSGCGKDCKFFFIFEETCGVNTEKISTFLSQAIQQDLPYPGLACLDNKDTIKLYYPGVAEDCIFGIELKASWKRGTRLRKIDSSDFMIRDMKGCPITVGAINYPPGLIIKEKENGKLEVAGGSDGMLLLLIAEKLNFTIDLIHPTMIAPQDGNISMNSALLQHVASGKLEFAFGRFYPTNLTEMSKSFDLECITWAIPRSFNRNQNLIWEEFPWNVWILVCLVFVVNCTMEYVQRKIILLGNASKQDAGIIAIILDVVQINLGNPVTREPVSIGGKLMLTASLCYAVVMTTAYKTSLASILTTKQSTPTITSDQEMIDAGLVVGGIEYYHDLLKNGMDDTEAGLELWKRYVVYAIQSDAVNRMKTDENFALLARKSLLEYEKQRLSKNEKSIPFDIADRCVFEYSTTMPFRKGSPLLKPINQIIERNRESGIIEYFDRFTYVKDKFIEQKNSEILSAIYTKHQYRNIFYFYIFGILVSLLVFFIEIIIAKIKPKKRQRRRIVRRVQRNHVF